MFVSCTQESGCTHVAQIKGRRAMPKYARNATTTKLAPGWASSAVGPTLDITVAHLGEDWSSTNCCFFFFFGILHKAYPRHRLCLSARCRRRRWHLTWGAVEIWRRFLSLSGRYWPASPANKILISQSSLENVFLFQLLFFFLREFLFCSYWSWSAPPMSIVSNSSQFLRPITNFNCFLLFVCTCIVHTLLFSIWEFITNTFSARAKLRSKLDQVNSKGEFNKRDLILHDE